MYFIHLGIIEKEVLLRSYQVLTPIPDVTSPVNVRHYDDILITKSIQNQSSIEGPTVATTRETSLSSSVANSTTVYRTRSV